MPTRAADLMVECLRRQGVDRIFSVPGESYLALLDALVDAPEIDLMTARHEGGAGFMAVADAKITGKPGVCAVSRGPGATNAAIAVHVAQQDAVPLVLLIGQVARGERGRGAFQEVDYGQTFADMAKAVWEVHDADRLPEIVARAFQVARAATPGPTVIVLPEDMLGDITEAEALPALPVAAAGPGEAEVERALDLLQAAERPLLIAGGQVGGAAGRDALARAAAAHDLPVALAFKRQDLFDNANPRFAGYLGFKIPPPQVEQLAEADLILAVGTRLTDVTTQGYRLPRAPVPTQPLIHVYPDAGAIGGVFRTELGLPCDPSIFLERLAERPGQTSPARRDWRDRLHAKARQLAGYSPRETTDGVDFGVVVAALAARAERDAVLVTDAGNFSGWVHCLWPWTPANLIVGTVGGAMGMGMPGAVAAALRLPGRQVFTFIGDGGALMTGAELAVAAAHRLPLKVFVSNNGSYGTIRLHQERDYPRRIAGTALTNPDFARWAESFGATGLTVGSAGEAADAVAAALAAEGPVVVDVHSSLEAISPYTTIEALRGNR